MPPFGTRDGALLLVHLEAQPPLDELLEARHHTPACTFAPHVDITIVRIADEAMPTTVELDIELVEHDVAE